MPAHSITSFHTFVKVPFHRSLSEPIHYTEIQRKCRGQCGTQTKKQAGQQADAVIETLTLSENKDRLTKRGHNKAINHSDV